MSAGRAVAEERDDHAAVLAADRQVAEPAAIGIWAATIALLPQNSLLTSHRCIEPPRPPQQPVSLHNSSAMTRLRVEPFGDRVPVPAIRGEYLVGGLHCRSRSDADRFLANAGMRAAATVGFVAQRRSQENRTGPDGSASTKEMDCLLASTDLARASRLRGTQAAMHRLQSGENLLFGGQNRVHPS